MPIRVVCIPFSNLSYPKQNLICKAILYALRYCMHPFLRSDILYRTPKILSNNHYFFAWKGNHEHQQRPNARGCNFYLHFLFSLLNPDSTSSMLCRFWLCLKISKIPRETSVKSFAHAKRVIEAEPLLCKIWNRQSKARDLPI